MSTSVSWPVIGGTSFSVPATGEVNWQALSNYLIALAGAQSVTSQKIAIRVATATPITVVSASDCVVVSNLGVAGAVAVNLPAGVTGQYFAIIDGKGDAATNNVTITGNGGQTINGAATYVINKNNGGVVLAFVSGNWTIFAEFSSFSAGSIPRSQIAAGTPGYNVFNAAGTGLLSEEAQVAASRGGLGADASAFTGVLKAAAGSFSASALVNADVSASAAIDYSKLNLASSIVNADISNSAAIAYSKLNLSSSIVNADVSGSAAIAYSKLNLATSIVNADISGSAAIAYSKLNLSLSIVNADISTSAAIALSKLATQAANTVVANVTGGAAAPTAVSLLSTATASAAMIRDANANVYANSFIENFTTTATAAGTTTLTVASSPILNFTGTTTQTVVMPVTSTLTTGHRFFITNRSTGVVTVNSSGSNLIQAMAPNTTLLLTCILTSGTTAASWDAVYGSTTGSISGSGLKNYIPAPNDNNAALWVASGGGIAVTTETTSTNFPDNITQTTAIKILRASGSDYVYTRFTVDQADYQVLCGILFAMKYAGTAGDYTLALYTNTAADYSGSYVSVTLPTTSIPSASTGTNFQTNGLAGGSGTQYMELRINGIAGTTPLYLNNVTFTPNAPAQGAAISEWQSITFATPSNLGTGSATNTAYFYRSGSTMVLKLKCLKDASGGSGASAVTFTMPTGYTINTAVLPTSNILGTYAFDGTNYGAQNTVLAGSTTTIVMRKATTATNFTGADFTANGELNLQLTIPISEWAGNGTLALGPGAQNEWSFNDSATTSNDTTSFGYGPQGFAIQNFAPAGTNAITKRIRFQYPIQSNDILVLEVADATGRWVALAERLTKLFTNDAGTTFYGATINIVNSTDVDVNFYSTPYPSLTWAGINTWSWRVRKSNPSSPVGFGLAGTDGSAGLYKPGSAPGLVTGATIASGYVGQVLTASGSAVAGGSTSQYANCASITLTAGNWMVSGGISFANNGATSTSEFLVAISGYSANTVTDHTSGVNVMLGWGTTAANPWSNVTVPNILVRSDGTSLFLNGFTITGQTLYLKGRTTYSTAAPTLYGTITAHRTA